MPEFLSMGGYAAYVWPAYAVAAAGLAWITDASLRARAKARRELAALDEEP